MLYFCYLRRSNLKVYYSILEGDDDGLDSHQLRVRLLPDNRAEELHMRNCIINKQR